MTTDDIFNVVAASIREVEPDLKSTPISRSDSMKLLGLQSVARVEVLMLSMENLGISVPNEDLVAAQNIGDLVSIFEQRLRQPG